MVMVFGHLQWVQTIVIQQSQANKVPLKISLMYRVK